MELIFRFSSILDTECMQYNELNFFRSIDIGRTVNGITYRDYPNTSLQNTSLYTGNPSPDWQGAGWYRFVGSNGTMMPESAPDVFHCGTHAPGVWGHLFHLYKLRVYYSSLEFS